MEVSSEAEWGTGKGDGPGQPKQAFGGGVLLGLELVDDQGLQGLRVGGSGELTVTDFLHILSIWVETFSIVRSRTLTFPRISFLTGVNATEPRTSEAHEDMYGN